MEDRNSIHKDSGSGNKKEPILGKTKQNKKQNKTPMNQNMKDFKKNSTEAELGGQIKRGLRRAETTP